MRSAATTLRERHRLVAAMILAAGLAAALVIYLTARPAATDPLGDPEDSKRYLREMEVYGGTANVLASELREWFEGLWHGERLAYTIASLAVLSAGGYWFFATRLQREPDGEVEGDGQPGGNGS